jgi:hypothetical protein
MTGLNKQRHGVIESCACRSQNKNLCEVEERLEDAQALDALVLCFRNAEREGQEKEGHHAYRSLLRKRLVLGTLLDRQGGAEGK